MEPLSVILSFIGIGISMFAYLKARNAAQAVSDTLESRNAQEDIQRISELIAALNNAKDAVSPWTPEMPDIRKLGRNSEEDLGQLSAAVGILRTRAPIDANVDLKTSIQTFSRRLDKKTNAIVADPSDPNLWKSALSDIHTLIPILERDQRRMRDKNITL